MQKFLINIFEWIKVLNSIKMYHNEESQRIKIKKTEKLDMLH